MPAVDGSPRVRTTASSQAGERRRGLGSAAGLDLLGQRLPQRRRVLLFHLVSSREHGQRGIEVEVDDDSTVIAAGATLNPVVRHRK